MKKEIEEILEEYEWLENTYDKYNNLITSTNRRIYVTPSLIDKILSLIEKEIEGCKDEIIQKLEIEVYEYDGHEGSDEIAQDIINIIIKRLRSEDEICTSRPRSNI